MQPFTAYAEKNRAVRRLREGGMFKVSFYFIFNDLQHRDLPFAAALAHNAQEPVTRHIGYIQRKRFVNPQSASIQQFKQGAVALGCPVVVLFRGEQVKGLFFE